MGKGLVFMDILFLRSYHLKSLVPSFVDANETLALPGLRLAASFARVPPFVQITWLFVTHLGFFLFGGSLFF